MVAASFMSKLTGLNSIAAEEVTEQLRQLNDELTNSRKEGVTWSLARIAQETTVFSVWGGRGSGKSSILTSVAQILTDESKFNNATPFLIIGPIQPELFGPSDSILNVTLAELKQTVINNSSDVGVNESKYRDAITSLERAQLTTAVSQASIQMISNAAATVDEFGRQLQRVAGATSDLWQSLAEATAQVSDIYGLIVIIIDDPDLASTQTLEVFRDLRNLGSLPGVALLVGVNRDNVRRIISNIHDQQREIDWQRWPYIDPEIVSFEEKIFPISRSFHTSCPTPKERVQFVKLGGVDSITTLIQECAVYVPRCEGLIERALTSTDGLADGSPLPGRYRPLVQLWDHFNSMRSKAHHDLSDTERAIAVSRLCDILLSQIQPPRGVKTLPSLTWGSMISTSNDSEEKRMLRARLLSLIPGVVAENFRYPVLSDKQNTAAELQLRPISSTGTPYWIKSDEYPKTNFDPNGRVDDFAVILAIQEIIWDSRLFNMEESEERFGGGLRPPEFAFLQVVRVEGQDTDDYFVTLPNAKTWSTVLRTARAWNGIVDRWREERLGIREVLALSLNAAAKICYSSDEFRISDSIIEYDKALRIIEIIIQNLITKNTLTLAEQELVNWYIGFVPAHWHSSIFDSSEIEKYLHSWNSIYPHFSSKYGSRIRRPWTLVERIGQMLDQSPDAGLALRYAWIGGYEKTLNNMTKIGVSLSRTRFERILNLWNKRITARRVGATARSLAVKQVTDDSDHTEGITNIDDEEFSEGLMEAALLAIEQWQEHASPR